MGLPGGKGRKEDKVEFIPYTPSPAATNLECCLSLSPLLLYTQQLCYIDDPRERQGRFMPTAAAQRSGEVSVWPPARPAEQSYDTYDIARTPVITGRYSLHWKPPGRTDGRLRER